METKCPHCGTVYDVLENEVGTRVTCNICNKDFIVLSTRKCANQKKRIVVSNAKDSKTMHSHTVGSVFVDRGDVAFISPSIARILQYILYIVSVVIAFVQLGAGVMLISNGDAEFLKTGCILIASSLVGLLIALLLVRLFYEGVVALFEIVRHLREIRDKLYD